MNEAVTSLPLSPPQLGFHWEECDSEVWAEASREDRCQLVVGGQPRIYAVLVRDAPLLPTTPGEHKMVRLRDEQIFTALLARDGMWYWLDINGFRQVKSAGLALRYLRPACLDPAPTDAQVEAAGIAAWCIDTGSAATAAETRWLTLALGTRVRYRAYARAALIAAASVG